MHFLRNKDREAHRDSYPVLYHPEMYLLDGGYKVSRWVSPDVCTHLYEYFNGAFFSAKYFTG